jgi:hypothetical protein
MTAACSLNPRQELKYVQLGECQLATVKEDLEDKALVGDLLKILHHTMSLDKNERTAQYTGQANYQPGGNAHQGINKSNTIIECSNLWISCNQTPAFPSFATHTAQDYLMLCQNPGGSGDNNIL